MEFYATKIQTRDETTALYVINRLLSFAREPERLKVIAQTVDKYGIGHFTCNIAEDLYTLTYNRMGDSDNNFITVSFNDDDFFDTEEDKIQRDIIHKFDMAWGYDFNIFKSYNCTYDTAREGNLYTLSDPCSRVDVLRTIPDPWARWKKFIGVEPIASSELVGTVVHNPSLLLSGQVRNLGPLDDTHLHLDMMTNLFELLANDAIHQPKGTKGHYVIHFKKELPNA